MPTLAFQSFHCGSSAGQLLHMPFYSPSMKLATYRDGSRDGQLVVVSRDLRFAHYAAGIASRLQQVLDDWSFMAPQLQDLYQQLNSGRAPHAFAFDPMLCMAPLPRAMQWVEAAAYPSHLALTQPDWSTSTTEPLLRQGSSDHFFGACDEIVIPSAARGIDFGAGLAAITGDLPTPIKYYNPDIKTAYKEVERIAGNRLLDMLPAELRSSYTRYVLKTTRSWNPSSRPRTSCPPTSSVWRSRRRATRNSTPRRSRPWTP